MKTKAFVVLISLLLLLSGILVAVEGNVGRKFVDENIEDDEDISLTQDEPVRIQDWYDLNDTRDNLDGNYILMNDLSKNTAGYEELVNITKGWNPIGSNEVEFNGSFDGNGHEIRELFIDRSGSVGLFRTLGPGAEVTDVELIDVDVSGEWGAGGLVGWNEGIIENSSVTGDVDGYDYVGGLVGITLNCTVKNSHSTCEVSGNNRVGGLIGGFYSGSKVINSYATGDVVGERYTEEGCVGGLIGANRGSTVENSYASGNVNGYEKVGGLIGENDHLVNHSYATGEVNGRKKVAGLVGDNKGLVSNSYATGNVSGFKELGGLVGSVSGKVNNSHYNIDKVLIKGENHITIGGIFDQQYKDWKEDKRLEIEDYSDTLVPEGKYYEISDIQGIRDLLGFAGHNEKKFRLDDDIDLSGEPELHVPYFSGEFDGNNHIISGLNLNKSFSAQLGMFSYNDEGKIENIDLVDAEIVGDKNVAGLVGINNGIITNSTVNGYLRGSESVGLLCGLNKGNVEGSFVNGIVHAQDNYYNIGGGIGLNKGDIKDCRVSVEITGNISDWGLRQNLGGLNGKNEGRIENSHVSGTVTGSNLVGGLTGRNNKGEIVNSSSTANVTGNLRVGGLVGDNQGGSILKSCSKGKVIGYDSNIGGLVGRNAPYGGEISGVIENTYALGNVSASNSLNVGGLVGYNSYHGSAYVNNSYAIGDVKGKDGVGGLIGYNGGQVTDSFSISPEMGVSNGEVHGRVTNANETDMKGYPLYTQISYPHYYDLDEPWDFVGNPYNDTADEDIWDIDKDRIINDGYPFLTWERKINKPSVPINLQASAGDEQVELTWDPPSDNGGTNITEYRIYRKTNSGSLSLYESVDGNTTTYLDKDVDNGQTYYYSLSAVNPAGESDKSVEVNATPTSGGETIPPKADAGIDKTVSIDERFTLNGSDSTDNIGIVNYTWTGDNNTYYGEEITLSFSETKKYIFTLNVTDAAGNYDTDTVNITVMDMTDPTADAGEDKTVDEDTVVTFDGSGSSDNVDIVDYTWTIEGSEYYGITVDHTFTQPGEYTVELNVTDEAGNTDTDTIIITVEKAGNGDTGRDNGIPGFTVMLLLLSVVIAVVVCDRSCKKF